jgi:hypothetical protein
MEYLSAEVLELAGNAARDNKVTKALSCQMVGCLWFTYYCSFNAKTRLSEKNFGHFCAQVRVANSNTI